MRYNGRRRRAGGRPGRASLSPPSPPAARAGGSRRALARECIGFDTGEGTGAPGASGAGAFLRVVAGRHRRRDYDYRDGAAVSGAFPVDARAARAVRLDDHAAVLGVHADAGGRDGDGADSRLGGGQTGAAQDGGHRAAGVRGGLSAVQPHRQPVDVLPVIRCGQSGRGAGVVAAGQHGAEQLVPAAAFHRNVHTDAGVRHWRGGDCAADGVDDGLGRADGCRNTGASGLAEYRAGGGRRGAGGRRASGVAGAEPPGGLRPASRRH